MHETQIPLVPDPKSLLLEMAQRHKVADVLKLVVDRLATSEAVVLARIWLKKPGEGCSTCPMRSECPDQTTCLHLVASAGTPRFWRPRLPTNRYWRLNRFSTLARLLR